MNVSQNRRIDLRIYIFAAFLAALPFAGFTEQSFDEIYAMAHQGDPVAQYDLGKIYLYGRGVERDYSEALRWYRLAAEQGDINAQFQLGTLYAADYYPIQDYSEALNWYHKAAMQNHSTAQCHLGIMYYQGVGVLQDYVAAYKWCHQAANGGDAEAGVMLFNMYFNGNGVKQNYSEGVRWLHVAAEKDNPKALSALGMLYFEGHSAVAQNYKDSFKWHYKLADSITWGDPEPAKLQAESKSFIAHMYQKGLGIEQDDGKAFKWFYEAAIQNNAVAQYELGLIYAKGRGLPQDFVEAYAWFNLSAAQNNKNAITNREIMLQRMTTEQIAEGQKRSKELSVMIKGKI